MRRSDRGLSLVEAAIILSVLMVLAGISAPAVGNYVEAARQARAREDVRVIGGAIQDFIADNAENQFLIDASNGTTSQPPTRPDSNRVNLLVSDGDTPALAAALVAETFWTAAVNGGTVDTLSNHLIENTPAEAAGGNYRDASDITVVTPGGNNIDFARASSSGYNAPYAWRGAYLRGPVDPDPWGNRYAVNVAFLDPSATAAVAGITAGFATADYPRLDVFVLSAGPDEEIDTRSAQDGPVPGDDDVIHVVSAHASNGLRNLRSSWQLRVREARGLSLVEASIILAVVAILSAALAPAVGGYINDAQHVTARQDVEIIGSALSRMLTDVGESWILRDGNGAATTNPPSRATVNRVDLLVSSGSTPTVASNRVSAGVDWDDAVNDAAIQRLDSFLVYNTPSNAAANAYRTPASMSVLTEFDADSGALYNAEHGWRGAYLPGPIGADPWGTRYAVNVEFLARTPGAGPSGHINDVVVVSAGPDRTVDTRFDVDGATSGSDVLYVVSGGTR